MHGCFPGLLIPSFLTMLDRRAFKAGSRCYRQPGHTSVIGRINYISRYGISSHEAAALVIARRIQGYSESPVPARTASPLPARNRGEHVWKFWSRLKEIAGVVITITDSIEGGPYRAPQAALKYNKKSFIRTTAHPYGHLPKLFGKAPVVIQILQLFKQGTCVIQGANP